ncbi:C-X-C chemokine receptor type 3-2 [Chanos chanos]|uniref:C-X-C chemokine receptor type 3-2 n=1 Tax=Chanos chanos TaxID=29144 RepID=A0A6J2W9A6_CHACN|nr:C-X-C chemokine receptor type 3-2-like [Chanos chanos]
MEHQKTMATTEEYSYDYIGEDTNASYPDLPEPCSHKKTLRFARLFCPLVYSLVFVVAVVGNVLVLCVIRRYRRAQHSPCSFSLTDTFLLHLAVSDLLLALTLPFFSVQWAGEWVFGPAFCKFTGALFSLNVYCGILFLACISFDRYLAIVHAISTGWRRDTCLAHVACAVIWVGCMGLACVDFQYRDVVRVDLTEPDEQDGPLLCDLMFEVGTSQHWQVSLQMTGLFVFFGLPLLVMLYCYARIFRALCHASRRQKRRSLRLIVWLVCVFVLCWAPYNGLRLTDSLMTLGWIERSCWLYHVLDVGSLVTQSLGLAHCAFNPLLYGFVGVKFRRELAQMCKEVLGSCGYLGEGRWSSGRGSQRRVTGSFSSAESDNTSFFTVML